MADQRQGGISWTSRTWNPVRGCSRVSAGCANCYAEPLTARFSGEGKGMWGRGLAVLDARGARWTGKVVLVESKLADPLRWRKPQKVFVNSISDLFHENLDGQSIAKVFASMALARHHTFQVLTKRAARMREIVNHPAFANEVFCEIDRLEHDRRWDRLPRVTEGERMPWPLPNVWLGVSVEHQEAADERIHELLGTPAAVRFLSCEPLLGPVDLRAYLEVTGEDERGHWSAFPLHWVIVGGESGPGARRMAPEWAESILAQCAAAGVPAWFKQTGSVWARGSRFADRAGADPAEWPAGLNVQRFPEEMRREGK